MAAGQVSREFDGTDDTISNSTLPDSDVTGAITLCLWTRIETGSAFRHFAAKHAEDGDNKNPFDFRTSNDAAPKLTIVRAASPAFTFHTWNSGTNTLTLGKWHFVGVTVADGDIDTQPRFHLDDLNFLATDETDNGNGTVVGSGADLVLGRRPDGAVIMDGQMAHFHIYNRVLSGDELNHIKQFPGSITKGLKLYYPLGRGNAFEPDLSGNGHTGTVNGATLSPQAPPISGMFKPRRPEWAYTIPADAPEPAATTVDQSFVFTGW